MTCRVCGCTEDRPCPGGCTWIADGFCSAHVALDPELLMATAVPLELTPLALLALHGQLCLALRHPENTGPSRAIAERFVAGTEAVLVELGVLRPEVVAELHRVEADAAPRVILARG